MFHPVKGQIVHGFQLLEIEDIKDLDAVSYTFRHIQSGARVFHISNADKNRVFYIAFQTPPDNDCGTAHILEHSVLCGSKNYPIKDPFNELAKGSLNTFLNAMTYADKTVYPIASTNINDFRNLKDVYLDAVFHPLIYNKKEIFMQEGWHYELEKSENPLVYKGVVYNEMKGALSDQEAILSHCIATSLFPTSIYRFESGGDPQAIPDLTYESFLDFHKKYYHPSNSYIYFYGDLDIVHELKHLDAQYLSEYHANHSIYSIMGEKSHIRNNRMQSFYPAAGESDGTYFACNFISGRCTDPKLVLSFDILNYVLSETNASPIKRAVVDGAIAEELEGWFDSSTLEMVFSFVAKNAKAEKSGDFRKTVYQTLSAIAEKGLDKKLLESSLNAFEFHMKEENFGYRPKGLVYGLMAAKSWIHGASPAKALNRFALFEEIRQEAKDGYFERLIEQYFLNNDHCSIVTLLPQAGKQQKIEQAERDRLDEIKKTMDPDVLKEIIVENKSLQSFQTLQDKPEDIAKIPLLSLNEIDKKISFEEVSVVQEEGVPLLFAPPAKNGIVYLQLLFNTSQIPVEKISFLGLLSSVLTKLDTKNYSFEALPTVINSNTGGISSSCTVYSKNNQDYSPKLILRGKALSRNSKELILLMREILENTLYEKKENLLHIIKAEKILLQNEIINSAHSFAVEKSLSNYAPASQYKELVSGISYYQFLCETEHDFEQESDKIISTLQEIAATIFTQSNLSIAVCASEQDFSGCKQEVLQIYSALPQGQRNYVLPLFSLPKKNTAIMAGGKVVYNAKALDFLSLGYAYNGKMQVLKTILNLEYLWNCIRVQGGAYGGGCNLTRNGNLYFYSYRDPNLEETFHHFNQTAVFLESLEISKRDMTKYIIGTLSSIDRPKTTQETFDYVIHCHLSCVSKEMLQKSREEILQSTLEDTKSFTSLFYDVQKTNHICVIGNESKIKEAASLFDAVISLN